MNDFFATFLWKKKLKIVFVQINFPKGISTIFW